MLMALVGSLVPGGRSLLQPAPGGQMAISLAVCRRHCLGGAVAEVHRRLDGSPREGVP